jgi:hypothetical protein
MTIEPKVKLPWLPSDATVSAIAHYLSRGDIDMAKNLMQDYGIKCWREAWRTQQFEIDALKQPAQAVVPEGWKLVPINPTIVMLKEGMDGLGPCVGSCGEASPPNVSDIQSCWESMLNAAPDSGEKV